MQAAAQAPSQQEPFNWVADPWTQNLHAGVDEVGIGPLAGPVTAAAVLLNPNAPIEGLRDSKQLSAAKREQLAKRIKQSALSWCLGWASVSEIDELNILRASHLAMCRAVEGLDILPNMILVDGNKTPNMVLPVVAVVRGDRRIPQISAASILAKVARDKLMHELDEQYCGYGFAKHKGYPTKFHIRALGQIGASPVHRQSFAPVRKVTMKPNE